jgi:hypothetical protein
MKSRFESRVLQIVLALAVALLTFRLSLRAQSVRPEATRLAEELAASTNVGVAAVWIEGLIEAGVRAENIVGVDSSGIPLLCGNGMSLPEREAAPALASASTLPAGTHSWETIPCVIRDDGMDSFRLEVNVNGPVQAVRMPVPVNLLSASGNTQINLSDDGQGEDRVAGDYVFTSERLRLNTSFPNPFFYYLYDTNSPAGLSYVEMHYVDMVELNGTTNRFMITPQVGVLDRRIPATGIRVLSGSVQVSPHLINVQTTSGVVQEVMRAGGSRLSDLSIPLYQVLPDEFDFLFCISTDHLETFPVSSGNFIAGINVTVKVDFTGSGRQPYDSSASYGSRGRLKSLNLLDTGQRGVYCNNATHELLHSWSAFLSFSLGLSQDGAHYKHRSNIGSLVGGQLWNETPTNTFVMNCEEGRNGAHRAPPLDRYMMGLVGPSAVPVSRAYSDSRPGPLALCDQVISNIVTTLTIEQIITAAGPRVPGPSAAQRNFSLGFVAGSRQRLFNPTEMTFYEILAAYYTKPLSPAQPDPYLTQNWVPITRFFGEDVKWRSAIASVGTPTLHSAQRLADGRVTLSGNGFPGQSYTVERSMDLVSWNVIGATVAHTNTGAISFTDTGTSLIPHNFYRLSWH